MIGSVQGLLRRNQDQQVEVETPGGLGYELAVPLSVSAELPSIGQQVSLVAHLVVRDGAMELYGFTDQPQRALFRQLLGVGGIGPRTALGILSVFEPDDFVAAVLSADSKALTRAQGIGARTAKRIIAELQDSLLAVQTEGGSTRATAAAALQALSFNAAEAGDLVRRAALEGGEADDVQSLVKRALRLAAGGRAR